LSIEYGKEIKTTPFGERSIQLCETVKLKNIFFA
jgi:hypothetical protein